MRYLAAACLSVSVLATPVVAQDDGGGFLETLIEDSLSGAGRDVRITGFEGALSSQASLEELTIADENGIWLTLRNVTLDWQRTALLRGRLQVNALTAEEILLPRLPQADPEAPSPEATPFSLPDLPVSVLIDEISIDRVELGQPVLGAAAAVSLNGSARLDGGEGEVDLSIDRVDGQEGALTIGASYENSSQDLSILLNLAEPEGGIAAALLNLPGAPSLRLSVDGSGPLSEFEAAIELDTEGERRLDGTVALVSLGEGDDARQGFTVEIGGDITPLFAPQYRPFFGPDVQLAASGGARPDGGFALDELRLQAQALRLAGQVSIGADGLPDLIDITAEIVDPQGEPVILPAGGDPAVQRADLFVQFDASQSEEWTANVTLQDFDAQALAAARIALNGQGIIQDAGGANAVTANFDFAASGLSAESADLAQALGDRITGAVALDWRSGAPLVLDQLQVMGEAFALNGSGQVAFQDGTQASLTAQLDAANLAAFSGVIGRDLGGAATVALDLTTVPLDGRFAVAVTGTTTDLQVDQAQADALLAGQTDLILMAERDQTGTRLNTLSLINPALRLAANGTLTSGQSALEADVRLVDTSLLSPDLSGPATVTLQADKDDAVWRYALQANAVGADIDSSGTVSPQETGGFSVTTDTQADAPNLTPFSGLAGRDLAGAVNLRLSGTMLADLTQADMSIDLLTRDIEVDLPEVDDLLGGRSDLSARVQRDGANLNVQRFALNATGAGLQAEGAVQIEDFTGPSPQISGMVDASADALSRFSALAGRPLGGAANLTVRGSARADLQTVDLMVNGTTRDVQLGQENLNRLLRGVTDLALEVTRADGVLRLPQLSLDNPQIAVSADGQYGTGQGALRANAAIADLQDLDARMRGQGNLALFAEEQGALWQITLDGSAADAVVNISGQLRDAMSPSRAFDGRASLRADDLSRFAPLVGRPLSGGVTADLTGAARLDLSSFDINADISARRLALGLAEVDRLLNGQTDLRLEAQRASADQPVQVTTFALDAPGVAANANGTILGTNANLTVSARLADIGPFVPGLNGPVTAQGQVRSSGTDFGIDLSGSGPGNISLRTSGTVRQDFSGANLSLNGQAPLEVANSFIAPRSLSGTLGFDFAVNGPLALSSVTGTVSAQNARFVAPSLNLILENIGLNVTLAGGTANLNVQADKEGGGTLTATGPIALSGGFDADLTITANGVVVEDPRLYRTSLTGSVSVDGPLTGGALIGGNLQLGETNVRIPSTGLGTTGPIPDGLVHINEPAAVRATRARAGLIETEQERGAGNRARPFPLDITITAANRIFIRGRGLDVEMGGGLTLQGTTANIIPAGQFELIRGQLDILGKRLTLTEGIVTLQGDFTPFLRLVARTDAGDVEVVIVVEGPALSPEIQFLSEPELPEEEVLARLLFGRSLTSISPLQAAQLASAVATLAGRGGDGVIANLRQATGLDDLDITTDDEGNAGVRAGKYLSENIYTDVTVGSSGEAELNLNLDITPNLTVRGGTSNTGESSLGIFFERDY